jgi:hypothetical protein
MKKIVRLTERDLTRLIKSIIKEEMGNEPLTDEELIDRINNLEDRDLNKITYNVRYDWNDVDEDKLMEGILHIISIVNPNADLEKNRMSLNRGLSELNDRLFRATQKTFSAYRGLKNYFEDNLYMF